MPWKRRPFTSRQVARALNIADLREIARRRMPGFAFEYVESGAEDEATLRGNRAALERLQLVPQTLVNTAARHQRTRILGRDAAAPLVIAPTGLNGLLQAGRRRDARARRGARRDPLHPEHGVHHAPGGRGEPRRRPAVDAAVRGEGARHRRATSCSARPPPATRRWCSPPTPTCSATANGTSAATASRDSPRCAPASTRCVTRAGCGDVLLRNGMPRFRNLEGFLPAGPHAHGREHGHSAPVRCHHLLGRHRPGSASTGAASS